jgi:hypothetical protein
MQGVYLVAAEFARLGFIASPTSRSALGADLLVTDQACKRAFSVQVKTNAVRRVDFLVGKHATRLKSKSLIYVLVNITKNGPEFFVVPSIKLVRLIRKTVRPNSIWYGVRCDLLKDFRDAWSQFGKSA